jgi:hypothetical protein
VGRELPLAGQVRRRAPAGLGMSRTPLRRRGTLAASLCAILLPVLASGSLEPAGVRPLVPPRFRGRHGRVTVTSVRLIRAREVTALVSACVPGDRVPGGRVVVERSEPGGASITFRGLWGAVDACDRAPRSHPRPWCGRASWPLRAHGVSDPRLAICYDGRNRPVAAFAWINPFPRTRWIVVEEPREGRLARTGRGQERHRQRPGEVHLRAVRREGGEAGADDHHSRDRGLTYGNRRGAGPSGTSRPSA